MQKISSVPLIDISLPVQTTIFYQACFEVQKLDIFHGEEISAILFNFLYTPPFSINFEWFGIADQNFINNSGSYFIYVALIVLTFTGRELISRVMIPCRRHEWARKLGVAASHDAYYFGMK